MKREEIESIMPKKKESPKGKECKCAVYGYMECGCDADWADNDCYNKAIDDCIEAILKAGLGVVPKDSKINHLFDVYLFPIEGEDWFIEVRQEFITAIQRLMKST